MINPALLGIGFPVLAPVAGYRVWYDAGQIVGLVNDDPVDTWEDLSANAFDLTSTLTKRPLYKTAVLNGLPAVEFDGVDDNMVSANILYPTGGVSTVFAVLANMADPLPAAPHELLDAGAAGWERRTLQFGDGAGNDYVNFLRNTDPSQSLAFTPGEDLLVSVRSDGANSILRLNADGGRQATWTADADTTASVSPFRLGCAFNESGYFAPARVCEVIVYPTALSDTDFALNEAYLKNKYGIA